MKSDKSLERRGYKARVLCTLLNEVIYLVNLLTHKLPSQTLHYKNKLHVWLSFLYLLLMEESVLGLFFSVGSHAVINNSRKSA